MRFEFIELIPSLAFVKRRKFLGPRVNALALLLIFPKRLVFRGTAVPKRVDEVLGLPFEGLLAQFHQ